MEAVAHENYKWSGPGRVGILASVICYSKKECSIARAKMFAMLESPEIGWVAYIGEITNIGSFRKQKF